MEPSHYHHIEGEQYANSVSLYIVLSVCPFLNFSLNLYCRKLYAIIVLREDYPKIVHFSKESS